MITRVPLAATALLACAGVAFPLAGQTPGCAFRGDPAALAERPSPLDSVIVTLGGAEAKLCYGRPSARGRTIVGELDPWGQPWRLGANEPTTLHLPVPARVGDVDLEPGSYTLYAIPEADAWTIVVNSSVNRWGIPINAEVRASDVGGFEVRPTRSDDHVETLEFSWSEAEGVLTYRWESIRFDIPIRRR